MSETLRKRGREAEALQDSIDVGEPKRFHREETERFLQLLQLDETLSVEDEEEYTPSEELVNGIMRSLEEEIAVTCSTSYHLSRSGDNLAAVDTSSSHEGQTRDSNSGNHLCYLREASDEELGIPPSPNVDLKHEVCQSPKETQDALSEGTDLELLSENWHFEVEFENNQQFAVFEDAWDASQLEDYMNSDFISQGILLDGEFSAGWRLETAGGM